MIAVLLMAARNLRRYTRRTLLIVSLIAIGVTFVQVYIASSSSYKGLIISQITDSMLGYAQIHRKGYLTSIENVPLNLNLGARDITRIRAILDGIPGLEAYSMRIRFGAMLSNYAETTTIRVYAVKPEDEFRTVPLLAGRISTGEKALKPGMMIVPELLAKGMKLKVGDPIVLVATNRDGSVNGKQFTVSGIVETAPGPGGRDGYIHINDAVEVLRMNGREFSEIALRLSDFNALPRYFKDLSSALAKEADKAGRPKYEVHRWESLTPFSAIVKMVDLMTIFVKMMLISIVLISVMNAMIMSVYERTRETGTLAAIGTMPNTILTIFMSEGLLLGIAGVVMGNTISFAFIQAIRLMKFSFAFGMKEGFILAPSMSFVDVLYVSVIVIIVSILGSMQPAWRASRLEPIKALRSV